MEAVSVMPRTLILVKNLAIVLGVSSKNGEGPVLQSCRADQVGGYSPPVGSWQCVASDIAAMWRVESAGMEGMEMKIAELVPVLDRETEVPSICRVAKARGSCEIIACLRAQVGSLPRAKDLQPFTWSKRFPLTSALS